MIDHEALKDSGLRAGRAARVQDVALVAHEKAWLAQALPQEEDLRAQALEIWHAAYRNGRGTAVMPR